MLPISHPAPIIPPGTTPDNLLLADAFSEFISASARLELSYRELQCEVSQLGVALAERNAELEASVAKNQGMREALQQILDSLPCGVLVLNRAGEITLANPEAARLLELTQEQMTSVRGLADLRRIGLPPLPSSARGEAVGEAKEQELAVTLAAGKRWIAIRQQFLSESGVGREGSGNHAVVTLRDISAEKKAESEREAARNAIALAEMSTVLAHEIRNPLASLELFAGLLADSPEQREAWISALRAGIRSLSGTVNNVLRLQAGGALPLETLELGTEVWQAVKFIEPIAEQAGVRITFRSASGLESADGAARIRGNRSALQQIMLNLAGNAIRHTPARGAVDVSVAGSANGPAGRAVVRVKDTGCGISPELIERIFDPGFSGSGQTPGLGLAVCRQLMSQHGGEIHVSSPAMGGSTFTLEFPAL